MTTNINQTDYSSIASLVFAENSNDNEIIEVEYMINGYSLFVAVQHDIEHIESVGGSYSDTDYETISIVSYEKYFAVSCDCYDSEGETAVCDFKDELLTKILNS